MKKTWIVTSLVLTSTLFSASLGWSQERPLHHHHQRFKQKLNPQQSQRRLLAPAPNNAVFPDSTAEMGRNYSQPQASELGPAQIRNDQPAFSNPPQNGVTDYVPDERYTQNNAVDMRGLLANDRSGSPLSGPLNTIGDFFAPSSSVITLPAQNIVFQGTATVVNPGSNFDFSASGGSPFPNSGVVVASLAPQGGVQISVPGTAFTTTVVPAQIDNLTSIQPVEIDINTGRPRATVDSFVVTADGSYQFIRDQGLNQVGLNLGGAVVALSGDLTANRTGANTFSAIQAFTVTLPGTSNTTTLAILGAPGAQLGRTKLTEQNSPLPRDRIFFDYSFFNNAVLSQSTTDVHRFAPGFEKTFFNNFCSLEMRVPMGLTLNSSQTFGSLDVNHGELGNISFAAKGMLLSTENFVLTSGLGVQIPTADDNVSRRLDGTESIRVANKQVRLLPYIATLHMKGNWFWQNYVQVDAAASGNDVIFNGQKTGVLQEQNFLYMDSSLSRWMYRDYRRGTGWVLTGEAHYNRTLGTADSFTSSGFIAGTPGFEADIVNLTFGSTYVYGKTSFTTAYGTPVTQDRGFDGELRFLINRFF